MSEVVLKNVKKIYPHTASDTKKKKKAKKGEETHEENKVNLQITDKGVVAVQEFNIDIKDKEFIVLVGPSGCGKSTLLSLIAGLMQPEAGNMSLGGIPLTENSSKIGYMLQHDHLFEWRTVYRNVILGAEIRGKVTPQIRARAEQLLEQYGLERFARSRPSELSGGMRQRAALIRTLLLDPELLLLDEPFSALDYQTRLTVSDDIGQIIRRSGKTALLVTHDLSEAVSLSDRVIVLSKRPASIVRIVPVRFSLEKDTPLNRRNAPEFKTYFNEIWKELNHDE